MIVPYGPHIDQSLDDPLGCFMCPLREGEDCTKDNCLRVQMGEDPIRYNEDEGD